MPDEINLFGDDEVEEVEQAPQTERAFTLSDCETIVRYAKDKNKALNVIFVQAYKQGVLGRVKVKIGYSFVDSTNPTALLMGKITSRKYKEVGESGGSALEVHCTVMDMETDKQIVFHHGDFAQGSYREILARINNARVQMGDLIKKNKPTESKKTDSLGWLKGMDMETLKELVNNV